VAEPDIVPTSGTGHCSDRMIATSTTSELMRKH
jgi:hypothetical protein